MAAKKPKLSEAGSPTLGDERAGAPLGGVNQDNEDIVRLAAGLEHLAKCDANLAKLIAAHGFDLAVDGVHELHDVARAIWPGVSDPFTGVANGIVSARLYAGTADILLQELRSRTTASVADPATAAAWVHPNGTATPRRAANFPRFDPEAILRLADDALHGAAGGPIKGAYLRSAARAFTDTRETRVAFEARLAAATDAAAHALLLKIGGVGPAAAAVALIVGLGRLDVLPLGDRRLDQCLKVWFPPAAPAEEAAAEAAAGAATAHPDEASSTAGQTDPAKGKRKAPKAAAKPKGPPKPKAQLEKEATARVLGGTECWRPYRSVACMLIWHDHLANAKGDAEGEGGEAEE